jgi:hypothetical protein
MLLVRVPAIDPTKLCTTRAGTVSGCAVWLTTPEAGVAVSASPCDKGRRKAAGARAAGRAPTAGERRKNKAGSQRWAGRRALATGGLSNPPLYRAQACGGAPTVRSRGAAPITPQRPQFPDERSQNAKSVGVHIDTNPTFARLM